MFPRFWFVETTRMIHHKHLLFTILGKKHRHIESMTSKVQPAADDGTVDRKTKNTRDKIVLNSLQWLGFSSVKRLHK